MRRPTVQTSWFDRAAASISPAWGASRIKNKFRLQALTEAGYVTPGSRKKSMKGITATANSPDRDINDKLSGMRALSRDLFMNAPLAAAILRRHKTLSMGSGLQVQAVVDRDFLGLTQEQAEEYEKQFEREFDLWAESTHSDFDGMNFFGDNQALGYLNLLMSGDFFFMPVWREAADQLFPYELCIKMIDADLVRNPMTYNAATDDIQGGVEKDSTGRVVAYHVWNCYPYEYGLAGKIPTCTRVPVFDESGRQQIYHVVDPERISQRRGVPLLAPVADALKQITRLSEAELMSALVASFFTVFVKDQSGMNAMLGPALTPEEAVTGGGRYDPNAPEVGSRNPDDGNDLEMGYGNVTYLDDKKDIEIAEPKKTDENFEQFFNSLAIQVCAGGNISKGQALLNCTASYTAAKDEANNIWKGRLAARTLMTRKMNQPVYLELMTEAILKGRVQAPGFFDDYSYRRAWSRTSWVGTGQGYLNPLQEAKANVINLNSFLSTHEEIYQTTQGGRWDSAMDKRAREEAKLSALGLMSSPDPTELIGPDGQMDEPDNQQDGQNA